MRAAIIGMACTLAAGPLLGCGRRPTKFVRDDGAVLVGHVAGADETRIWVDVAKPARRVVVQRDRLTDIGHPGKSSMIWGGAAIAGGGLMLVPFLFRDDEPDDGGLVPDFSGVFIAAGIGLLAAGIPALVIGVRQRADSEAAVSPTTGPPAEAATLELGPTGLRVMF